MASIDSILSSTDDLGNLELLCRLCGKLKEPSSYVFDETQSYNYAKVINLHFKEEFEVSPTDILPLKLCPTCLATTMSWHEFYQCCAQTNKKFHQLVEKFDLYKEKKPEKVTVSTTNDIEVIEVSVDGDNYDFMNEQDHNNEFDISNVNIKDSNPLETDIKNDFDFDDIDTLDDHGERDSESSSDTEEETVVSSIVDKTPANTSNNSQKKTVLLEEAKKKVTKRKRPATKIITPASGTKRKRASIVEKTVAKITRKSTPIVKIPIASTSKKDKKPAKVDENAESDLEIAEIDLEFSDLRDEDETEPASNSQSDEKSKKTPHRPPKMCDICGKVVSSKQFREHMTWHLNPETMTCSCCGKVFSSVSTLKKHFIWTHTTLRPFMCDICGNTFKRNDHLKLHRDHYHSNSDGPGTALKCGMCGSSMQTFVSLQSHMKRIHGTTKVMSYDKDVNHKILADKSYECGICNLNFKQFSYLRIHIKFVHEKGLPWNINQGASGPYKCDPCSTSYATLQSLREHNRRRHDNAPVEKFSQECSHCGMLYRNRLHYSKHLAKISGRPTCYVCWVDFDNTDLLKAHINKDHINELPFGCELCGVRFVYLTELRNHMYTHSKTRQFKCDMCSQSFVRKDFLKSHMRRHLGIRNHVCEECNKSFVEFCDLRKHMQIHMKNKFVPVADT